MPNAECQEPRSRPEFAPGLIAPKSLKPCDGGVFLGLNSLLKTEQKKRNPKCRSSRLFAACSLPFARAACLRFGGAAAQSLKAATAGRNARPKRRCRFSRISGLAIGLLAQHTSGRTPLKAECQEPRSGPESALALIAPKPLKPCDGAVFWRAGGLALRAIFRAVFLFKSGAWAGRYPNMTMRFLPGALALLAALMGAPAFGQAYKCWGPDGALAYADRPCAASHEGGPVELRPNTLDTRSGSQPVRSVQAGGPPDRPAGQRPARHRQNSWSCRNAVRSLQTQPQRTDARQLEQERQAVRQACGPAASAQALARQPARESKPAAAAKRPQRRKRPRSPAP